MSDSTHPIGESTRTSRHILGKPPTARRAARLIAEFTLLATPAGGFFAWLIDRAHFPTPGTGLWWAVQTVTAVAYGDVTPKHAEGRVIATLVMPATGASLHLIVAADPVVAGIEGGAEFTPLTNAPAVLKAALAAVAPTIDADGECLHPGRRQGHKSVAEAIAAACEKDVDILVAGTRKPLDRLLLGSVTGRLIDVAPCAVLVVPHEEAA